MHKMYFQLVIGFKNEGSKICRILREDLRKYSFLDIFDYDAHQPTSIPNVCCIISCFRALAIGILSIIIIKR